MVSYHQLPNEARNIVAGSCAVNREKRKYNNAFKKETAPSHEPDPAGGSAVFPNDYSMIIQAVLVASSPSAGASTALISSTSLVPSWAINSMSRSWATWRTSFM